MRAILDIEVGGFSITKNGVCEIGMLVIDDNLNVVKEINTIIKPYMREDSSDLVSYKDDAMAVNGITIEELHNGESVQDATFKISNALINYDIDTLIGHNIKAFDIPRIDYLLQRFQNISVSEMKCYDTLLKSEERFLLESYSLESLCAVFDIENPNPHRAIGDCYATLELYKRLK